MNKDVKKPQIVMCLLAGIGMFLPLYKITAYGQSANVTFMQLFDIPSSEAGFNIINCKIVLGILIVAFITLLVRFAKDNFWIKIGSLLLITTAGVLYFIDVNKMTAAKSLLSSMMKYGVGYYISLVAIIGAFILGLVDIFSNNGSYKGMDDYTFNELKARNNDIINQVSNNQVANNNVLSTPPVQPQVNQQQPINNTQNVTNQVRLSDLVNRNSVNNDQNSNQNTIQDNNQNNIHNNNQNL